MMTTTLSSSEDMVYCRLDSKSPSNVTIIHHPSDCLSRNAQPRVLMAQPPQPVAVRSSLPVMVPVISLVDIHSINNRGSIPELSKASKRSPSRPSSWTGVGGCLFVPCAPLSASRAALETCQPSNKLDKCACGPAAVGNKSPGKPHMSFSPPIHPLFIFFSSSFFFSPTSHPLTFFFSLPRLTAARNHAGFEDQ
jgi:hypothetical protein